MRLRCGHCGTTFEDENDDARCPKCLRKSSVEDLDAPKQERSAVGWRELGLRFVSGFASGSLLFFLLTIRGTILGTELKEPWMRIYAVLLGGVLVSVGWMIFPRLAPWRRK